MQHPSKIIKELGIHPLKRFGQNFQTDTHSVENAASFIPENSRILEIGPGLGAWTEVFLPRAHSMVLAEKDRTLAARLREVYKNDTRVRVLEGDFLEVPKTEPFIHSCNAAIGNLPFYITSELLLRVLVDFPFIEHALLGVQLEVAERLASGKGSSLAIALGSQGQLKIVSRIKRTSFFPVPDVDAALLSFTRSKTILRPHLRLLLKAAFWGKRKTLATALKNNPFWENEPVAIEWRRKLTGASFEKEAILQRRADDLTVEEFISLYDTFMAGA